MLKGPEDFYRTMPDVPGAHGGNMRVTRVTSVRDCRLSDKRPPKIRVAGTARPCGGYVYEAQEAQRDYAAQPLSQRAKKRAIRQAREAGLIPAHGKRS